MELLYHYCSSEAFFKIISSCIIRLANAKYMNDYLESTYAESVIEQFAETIIEEKKKKFFRGALQFYKRKYFINFYGETHSVPNTQREPYDFFIFCLSKDLNSLNQWRAYAGNATGFAIGFNKACLSSLMQSSDDYNCKLELLEIVYKPEEQLQIIEALLNQYAELGQENADIKLASLLYANSIRFKHPGFYEERESRLIFTEPAFGYEKDFWLNNGLKIKRDLDFYTKADALIPYYKLDFSQIATNFIKDIRLAPKNLTMKAM